MIAGSTQALGYVDASGCSGNSQLEFVGGLKGSFVEAYGGVEDSGSVGAVDF